MNCTIIKCLIIARHNNYKNANIYNKLLATLNNNKGLIIVSPEANDKPSDYYSIS